MKNIRAALAFTLIFGLVGIVPVPSAWAVDEPGAATSNILVGKVVMEDGTAVGGATIRAYHFTSGNVYSGLTSPETGSYLLGGLPDGSYEITIETEDGTYFLDQVLTIEGGTRTFQSYSLFTGAIPDEVRQRLENREISTDNGAGVANLLNDDSGGTVPGSGGASNTTVLTLSLIGGAGFLYLLFEDDDEGSPVIP